MYKRQLVSTARALAVRWIREASNEDGTFRLAFDQPNTFSLKYNAVWDQLFNTEIFPPHTFDTELRSYMERAELYGMPLDCREAYTCLLYTSCGKKAKIPHVFVRNILFSFVDASI